MTRLLIVLAMIITASPAQAELFGRFTTDCGNMRKNPVHCKYVGKKAFNSRVAAKVPALRKIYIGPILGVKLIGKDEVISRRGQEARRAKRAEPYYIIGPGGVADYHFLRRVAEIDPK